MSQRGGSAHQLRARGRQAGPARLAVHACIQPRAVLRSQRVSLFTVSNSRTQNAHCVIITLLELQRHYNPFPDQLKQNLFQLRIFWTQIILLQPHLPNKPSTLPLIQHVQIQRANIPSRGKAPMVRLWALIILYGN